jgi:hypothetical protein
MISFGCFNKANHCNTLKEIKKTTGKNVVGVYNATEGSANDLVQSMGDRDLIESAYEGKSIAKRVGDGRNPATDSISDLVYNELKQGNKPEIWMHSQGGATGSLGLFDAINRLKAANIGMENITVKSFASAAQRWPDGPTYEHYVHVNDLTPTAFGLGSDSKTDNIRAGSNAKVIRFSGNHQLNVPFETDPKKLDKNLIPDLSKYHGMEKTYIKMFKQEHP